MDRPELAVHPTNHNALEITNTFSVSKTVSMVSQLSTVWINFGWYNAGQLR